MAMRRFGSRWRDVTTPPDVLDIFEIEGHFDILFRNGSADGREQWADGIEVDPEGHTFPSFELDSLKAAAYRYRNGRNRRKWADLPEAVRSAVYNWLDA